MEVSRDHSNVVNSPVGRYHAHTSWHQALEVVGRPGDDAQRTGTETC